jgi:hypothetical protein
MEKVDSNTPIALLTVRQLQEVLGLAQETQKKEVREESPKKYVYGLAGIRKLFNISHATAQRYKDTIIADACFQQGRKIIVDVDKALELFSKKK